jgi:hypothetical protein
VTQRDELLQRLGEVVRQRAAGARAETGGGERLLPALHGCALGASGRWQRASQLGRHRHAQLPARLVADGARRIELVTGGVLDALPDAGLDGQPVHRGRQVLDERVERVEPAEDGHQRRGLELLGGLQVALLIGGEVRIAASASEPALLTLDARGQIVQPPSRQGSAGLERPPGAASRGSALLEVEVQRVDRVGLAHWVDVHLTAYASEGAGAAGDRHGERVCDGRGRERHQPVDGDLTAS